MEASPIDIDTPDQSARMRETERRYQSLFDNALDGIFRTTVDGRYLDANPALARIYGFASPQELIENLSDIRTQLYVQPGRREQFMEQIQRTGTVSNFESQVVRKDGEIIWISETARAIRNEAGEVVEYEGMVEDITEHKRREEELIAATEAAEAANRAKSQFLANMSHEIRTPMNGVLGMTELLLATPLDRTQLEYAQTIRTSAESLLAIINDLLDFSKIEAGKMQLDSTQFLLHEVLEEVAAMMAAAAAAKGLELIVRIAKGTPAVVCGDPQRLKQCLLNLVGNAIKFSDRGEIGLGVELAMNAEGEQVLRFEVVDEGPGIDPQSQQRLFEPFVQADSSVTRRFGGTGLGLSIVRALVSMMHGRVGVQSELELGSRFWFEIPCIEARWHDERAGMHEERRVLVVDTNRALREALAGRLEHAGCVAHCASETSEALRMLSEAAQRGARYRMVVTGLELEQSLELTTSIRAASELASISVVLMTSIDRSARMRHLQHAGFAGYVSKPVRVRDLLAYIEGQALAAPVLPRAPEPQTLSRAKRVLVVEDNAVNQKIAQRFLERLGCDVALANNGAEGVEMFRSQRYDLVLMDLQMPVMGGLEAVEVIRRVQAEGERTPIVALTAHAMSGEMERCLEAGMDDFLTKPLRFESLQQTIGRFLRRAAGQGCGVA